MKSDIWLVGGLTCDSRPQGYEFEPHTGCETYFKKKKKKDNQFPTD